MPEAIKVYYIQHIGDKLYINRDKIYDLALFSGEYIQPNTLSTSEEIAPPYDYTEVEVSNFVENVVLSKEIIVLDKISNLTLDGFIKIIAGVSVYGDKTEVTGVEFRLMLLRAKNEIRIAESKYVFRTPVSGNSGGYSSVVYAAMDEQINDMKIDGILILQISITGRVVEEGKTGGVALIHPRGSKQQNLVLSTKLDKVEVRPGLPGEKKRTKVINRKDVEVTNFEKILDLKGFSGRIIELTIMSPVKPDIYVYSDEIDLFTSHNSYDDLSTMAEFSDTVVAMQSIAGDYILNIKDIHFTKSIEIALGISGSDTIDNIFLIYDVDVEEKKHAN